MVKMKKILLSGVALAALFAAAPAQAADVPVRQQQPYYKAAPAPVFNWTGFYFGGHVGYGWGDTAASITGEVDGFTGGLQAGYNWQFSRNWVFGIEADITGTDMNDPLPTHVDYLGTLRARVGYAWDRTMLYGTGGLAFNRSSVTGLHDTDTGYALGAGIEWAFAPNWSAKVEYMYYSFDNTGPVATDLDVSTIKLGVNYRFGM
jgi:outer membrane immunogenic protein